MWGRIAASLLAVAGSASAAPCDAPEFRQFDFWVGEWKVTRPDGTLAGTNDVRREYAGCVVHERYTGGQGYSGESLNAYDAGRRLWHQTWVDSAGTFLLLEGGLRGSEMVLEGQTTDAKGLVTRQRITWTPNPDGTVRQHWETASETGAWSTAFDGLYRRTEPDSRE
jgi:hypothetical protein